MLMDITWKSIEKYICCTLEVNNFFIGLKTRDNSIDIIVKFITVRRDKQK